MASFSYHHHQKQRAISSPHRTVVWTEPKKSSSSSSRRKVVPVVYYLCREDGQLEHPHFMEVQVAMDCRLCLRDFTERLDMVRGKGMAAMYSWSSKRSYRNQGFVWHDLTEEDAIHPVHANDDYVLKGSHRFSSSYSSYSLDHGRRRRNNWSRSFDLAEYKQQSQLSNATEKEEEEEISPPPSSSSPEEEAGRMRASSVLMQLMSCGSFKTHSQSHQQQHAASPSAPGHGSGDRDCFSGSLVVETNHNRKKKTTPFSLERSSSCNADSRRMQVESKIKD